MKRDEVWQQLKDDKSLVYGEPILDVFLKIVGTSGPDPVLGGEMLNPSIDNSHYLELPIEKRRIISPSNRAAYYGDDLDDLKDAIRQGASTNSLNDRLRTEIFKQRFDFIEYLMNNGADDFMSIARYAVGKGNIELLDEIIEKIGNQIDSKKTSNFGRLPRDHAIEIILNESLQSAIKNLLEILTQAGYDAKSGKSEQKHISNFMKQFDLVKSLVEQKGIKIPKWIIDMTESMQFGYFIYAHATEMHENLLQYLNKKYKEQNE